MTIQLFDRVRLRVDNYVIANAPKGAIGTVVADFGDAWEVEFSDSTGASYAILPIEKPDVELATETDDPDGLAAEDDDGDDLAARGQGAEQSIDDAAGVPLRDHAAALICGIGETTNCELWMERHHDVISLMIATYKGIASARRIAPGPIARTIRSSLTASGIRLSNPEVCQLVSRLPQDCNWNTKSELSYNGALGAIMCAPLGLFIDPAKAVGRSVIELISRISSDLPETMHASIAFVTAVRLKCFGCRESGLNLIAHTLNMFDHLNCVPVVPEGRVRASLENLVAKNDINEVLESLDLASPTMRCATAVPFAIWAANNGIDVFAAGSPLASHADGDLGFLVGQLRGVGKSSRNHGLSYSLNDTMRDIVERFCRFVVSAYGVRGTDCT